MKSELLLTLFKKSFILFLGAICYAVGLRFFIIPNSLFDNGTTGICIIIYYIFHIPLGILFIIINIPFWLLGYKFISRLYSFLTILSIIFLSLIIESLKFFQEYIIAYATKDILLAAVFGGILIGFGAGLIIKNGGAMDGIETVSIMLAPKFSFTIGEIALFFNSFILLTAGIIFGFDKAMYSLVSYFISIKTIDLTIEGFNQVKNVMIISDQSEELATLLMLELSKSVTLLNATGGYSKTDKKVIYIVLSRFEISELKKIVNLVDPNAFVIISDVYEAQGGRMRKKKKTYIRST